MNKEQEIDIILSVIPAKGLDVVLRSILKRIDELSQGYAITRVRKEVDGGPRWSDEIWQDPEFTKGAQQLFDFQGIEGRHFNGGSSSPECDFTVAAFKCKLCGAPVDQKRGNDGISELIRHLQIYCQKFRQEFDNAKTREDFLNSLEPFKHKRG